MDLEINKMRQQKITTVMLRVFAQHFANTIGIVVASTRLQNCAGLDVDQATGVLAACEPLSKFVAGQLIACFAIADALRVGWVRRCSSWYDMLLDRPRVWWPMRWAWLLQHRPLFQDRSLLTQSH